MKNTITANILVKVECSSNWGDDCTIEQVKKQARINALNIINRNLEKDPLIKNVSVLELSLSTTL
jgi:hypothetical protein